MIEIPKSFDRASALVNAWLIAAPSRARGGLRSRDIRTASLLTSVSVSGKRDSEGQRQLAQNRLQAGKGLHGDRNADVGARQLRAFWKSQGNLAVRKSAWWGWKDSNLQTERYERASLCLRRAEDCRRRMLAALSDIRKALMFEFSRELSRSVK